ncbi:MAG: MAPEG family protein [Proteobacteria bacterium]|nr:MAPEG family protein [Pseudomonadota bacterium]
MTAELKYLAWSIVLGVVYVLVATGLSNSQRGLNWNVGNRDGATQPLTGAAGRAHRASRNFQETFPFFAAAVLAVVLAKAGTSQTALGAMLYFWARVLYLPVYVVGIPFLRTLVWSAAFLGLLLVLSGLF